MQSQKKHFLASIFCKVFLALLNRIQPILERLNENMMKPWKPSVIDRSNKWCQHWYSFKFKRLVILNVHDVKNQSINEQERAVLERCVNSIFYLHKKQQKCDSKVRTYHCSTCIEYIYLYQNCTDSVVLISISAQHCLYNSGKERCTRHMRSNDMFVLQNCNEISSNVMWTITNEADKTFVRTK